MKQIPTWANGQGEWTGKRANGQGEGTKIASERTWQKSRANGRGTERTVYRFTAYVVNIPRVQYLQSLQPCSAFIWPKNYGTLYLNTHRSCCAAGTAQFTWA